MRCRITFTDILEMGHLSCNVSLENIWANLNVTCFKGNLDLVYSCQQFNRFNKTLHNQQHEMCDGLVSSCQLDEVHIVVI
jgi:hypothetical protein